MTTKEELIREYARWSFAYHKADERLRSLLRPPAGPPQPPPPPSEAAEIELASAEDDLNNAAAKLKEIIAELSRLP